MFKIFFDYGRLQSIQKQHAALDPAPNTMLYFDTKHLIPSSNRGDEICSALFQGKCSFWPIFDTVQIF